MPSEVGVALISLAGTILVAVVSYCGVKETNKKANNEFQHKLDKHQAVQDEKLDNLTREVRKHNNFAERIPKVEQKLDDVVQRVQRLEK